ncbi:efflux RND transporter periplasmic adaptor subunit [Psychrosphaera haliotis]|uniref:Efflux RND transporter periplasmic adaptor subunit n=1 Tax=Psychrosphaera haliotis TaxID=555083 RepID=A0A6N8F6I6_9GAMM|nr:efflux RND transporter periplasmic adaptor subunit [Psychrosphaera haliotis]MUH72226.1 efflux RND transporter periplasmic adaptor subunit [Psychrosphaera haliotis]
MFKNKSVFGSKQPILAIALVTTALISGCSEAPKEEVKKEVAQAVKLVAVSDSPDSTIHTFPAEVSAVKTIDVSFEVKGRLQDTNLLTGTLVEKGDVLAKIDPTPFNQLVQEAKARLTQAKRNLDRVSSTYEKQLASQSEMDSAKTNYELAEIALQRAEQDLSYTTLVSPFDAQISERLVDNNSYVTAGQIIARVQDVSRFYFNINVPERIVSRYKSGTPITASAFIISLPERQYELEYVEHDTQPDPTTQTYKVVFAASVKDKNLTPGARAVVEVTIGSQSYGEGVLVPFTSLVGSEDTGFHVWRFNDASGKVESVDVSVLHIEKSYALVTGELLKGEKVVAAGANKMRAGLVVKPYRTER